MSHTVLLVDDDEDLRELTREVLETNGYRVVTAGDGGDALEKLAAIEELCLVLLDLSMPGMNGWDFFEAFRARPSCEHVPVVVHTSLPSSAPKGATRVLPKPIPFQILLRTVREYCAA